MKAALLSRFKAFIKWLSVMYHGAFVTLIKMQLKDKFNMSYMKKLETAIIKVVFLLVQFAAITVMFYFVFYICTAFNIFSLIGRIPDSVLTILITAVIVFNTLAAMVGFVKSLYLSRDNSMLLTMPITPDKVFLTKIIVAYINEVRKMFFTAIPIIVAYLLINRYPAVFYFAIVPNLFVISCIPVVLGSLLSIPALYVALFLRNIKYVQMVLVAVAVSAAVYVVFWVASFIPENFNLLATFGNYYWKTQDILKSASAALAPFVLLARMFSGSTGSFYLPLISWHMPVTALVVISGSAAVMFALYFVMRILFFKMAAKPNEHGKKLLDRKHKNHAGRGMASLIKGEFQSLTRSPMEFFASYLMLFALPFTIFLLNKIFASMNTRLRGDSMIMGFNLLMILVIALSSNIPLSYVFSKQGAAAYEFKILPMNPVSLIVTKLVVPFTLSTASLIITVVLMNSLLKLAAASMAMIFFISWFAMIAHMLWCVELDITYPQHQRYFGGIAETLNPNELYATLIAFLMSFSLFGMLLFFLFKEAFYEIERVLFVSFAFLLIRIYLLLMRTKVYFREF